MKMSNNTNGRPSALPPELSTDRPRASDDAPSTVILLALSHFCEGSPAPLPHVGPAAAGISSSFSVPSAFVCVLCVKSFAFRSTACPQNRQFLFNTNEPLPNFATRTKQIPSSQITTLFLFDTNERSRITTHQSLITNATGAFNDFHIRSAHGSMAAESLATKFNSSGKGKA